MKILLVNGSPHEKGCTYTALCELQTVFQTEGLTADVFWIGNKPLYSCIDCGKCEEKGSYVFEDRVKTYAGDFITLLEHGTWADPGAGVV